MKKLILPLFILLSGLLSSSQAQTIPNAGLENWNDSLGYDNPDDWFALNLGPSFTTVTKSTDKQEGSYAAKLEPIDVGQVIPAVLQIQFPATTMKKYLNFYAKYSINAADTFLFFFYVNDSNESGLGRIAETSVTTYTPFHLDLTGITATAYDSITLGMFLANSNSSAFVDNFFFSDTAIGNQFGVPVVMSGVNTINQSSLLSSVSIYPNPVQSISTIEFTLLKSTNVTIKVNDISGRELKTLIQNKTLRGKQNIQFDAQDLHSGMYFVTITTGDQSIVKKVFVTK